MQSGIEMPFGIVLNYIYIYSHQSAALQCSMQGGFNHTCICVLLMLTLTVLLLLYIVFLLAQGKVALMSLRLVICMSRH